MAISAKKLSAEEQAKFDQAQINSKKIQEYVKQANDALDKAVALSDETGIGFSWDLAYGMGGWYSPKPKPSRMTRKEALEKIASSEDLGEEELETIRKCLRETKGDDDSIEYNWESSSYNEYGWQASSASC